MADDSKTPVTKADLESSLQALEKRMVEQFKLIAENLAYDFKGIFKDRTEQHSDQLDQHGKRIDRLEEAVLR